MNGRMTSAVTIYRRKSNWMIPRALKNAAVKETHFETAFAANRFLSRTRDQNVGTLIIDRSIIDKSNGHGTKLINTFNTLGLTVIAILKDNQEEARWANESVYASSFHLREL